MPFVRLLLRHVIDDNVSDFLVGMKCAISVISRSYPELYLSFNLNLL